MISDKLRSRPGSLSPYQRLHWQQENCTDQVLGYVVALATERTRRAAYMAGTGTDITNNEGLAAVLPKAEASALMIRFHASTDNLAIDQFKIAFLVPVSADLPLNLCTFSGF